MHALEGGGGGGGGGFVYQIMFSCDYLMSTTVVLGVLVIWLVIMVDILVS